MNSVYFTNRKTINHHKIDGFALPTILIASVIMLSVLLVSVVSTASVRVNLNTQYYNQMSQTARDAGVVYANACLAANGGIPQWGDGTPYTAGGPLMPSTGCNGAQLAGFTCPTYSTNTRCSVAINDNAISTFSVGFPPVGSGGVAIDVISIGTTKLFRSDNTVWRQYSTKAAKTITGIGAITGNIYATGVLTAGSVTPSGAPVTYRWQSSSIQNGTYSDMSGTSSTLTLSSGDVGNYIRVAATGSGDYIGNATSAVVGPITQYPWLAGQAETGYPTALVGKYVYYIDAPGNPVWKTTWTACVSTQCSLTVAPAPDPAFPTSMVLVDPIANSGVVFSTTYPAQEACKTLGGRLPTTTELSAIYVGKLAGRYGYGTYAAGAYWSATEYNLYGQTARIVSMISGAVGTQYKNTTYLYTRCVR